MRKVALLVVLGAIGVLSVGAVAIADDGDGSGKNGARLNGYQETPSSISTTGFGSFHLKVSRDRQSVDYVLSYRDLEFDATQAHIHFAQRTASGGVAVFLCANGAFRTGQRADLPLCPLRTGTAEGTFRPSDLGNAGRGLGPGPDLGEWEELLAAIKVGHTYANVHTGTAGPPQVGWPGGEIRGQINDRDQKEYTGPPPFALGGGNDDD
jgi:CHRD domain